MLQTEKLNQFIKGTGYLQLPTKLREYVRLCLLDTIGCAVAGLESDNDSLHLVHTMNWSKCREATRIGRRAKVSVSDAFHFNAYSSSRLDFDRGKSFQYMHPGRLLILAAVATGEKLNVSYRELITAIALGYEMLLRVGHALRPIGWPLDETCPDLKLSPYCFSPSGIANIALKLLDTNTDGGTYVDSSLTRAIKNSHTQQSSCVPDTASLLDSKITIHLSDMFSLLTEAYDSDTPLSIPPDEDHINTIVMKLGKSTELAIRLGQKYLIRDVGLIPTSQCYYMQYPIKAVKKAIGAEYLDIDKIQNIDLIGLQWLALLKNKRVEDIADRMAMAIALLINNINPESAWYLNGQLENKPVQALLSKIRFFNDIGGWIDWMEFKYCMFRAIIETRDGHKRKARVKQEINRIDDIASENKFNARFSDITAYVLGEKKASKIQSLSPEDHNCSCRDLMKLVQPRFGAYF